METEALIINSIWRVEGKEIKRENKRERVHQWFLFIWNVEAPLLHSEGAQTQVSWQGFLVWFPNHSSEFPWFTARSQLRSSWLQICPVLMTIGFQTNSPVSGISHDHTPDELIGSHCKGHWTHRVLTDYSECEVPENVPSGSCSDWTKCSALTVCRPVLCICSCGWSQYKRTPADGGQISCDLVNRSVSADRLPWWYIVTETDASHQTANSLIMEWKLQS